MCLAAAVWDCQPIASHRKPCVWERPVIWRVISLGSHAPPLLSELSRLARNGDPQIAAPASLRSAVLNRVIRKPCAQSDNHRLRLSSGVG
jgi:hypothetical protein